MDIRSLLGYSVGSPWENAPYNLIKTPQGKITMSNTKKKLKAFDAKTGKFLSNLEPGKEYQFPTDEILEVPEYQKGGLWFNNKSAYVDSVLNANSNLNFVNRYRNPKSFPVINNSDGSYSTHKMQSGDGKVYPTVFQMPDGSLKEIKDSNNKWAAREYAEKTGEIIDLKNDEKAKWFAENGYKLGKQFQQGGWLQKYQTGRLDDPLRPKGLGVQTQDNTRPTPLFDKVKIDQLKINKENKEAINTEAVLRRAGMDAKNALIQANPRTRLKTSQKMLDEQQNKEYRTTMSQGYDPNKPIEQQYHLANIKGLDQRLYRGANMVMNQDLGNPILNVAKDVIFAPGKSFVNMSNPVENYVKPGFVQGAANLAMDALMIAPNMVGQGVGKAFNAGKQATTQTNIFGNIKNKLFSKSQSSEEIVEALRKELSENGIISQQKTFNFPWKEPIRKGVRPFGYDTPEKVRDIKSLFKDTKNLQYVEPEKFERSYSNYLNLRREGDSFLTREQYIKTFDEDQFFKSNREKVLHRFENRFSEDKNVVHKNRFATWDMYLGKPQTKHPMYDISKLTTSKKKPIYTIKEDFMDKFDLEERLKIHTNRISDLEKMGKVEHEYGVGNSSYNSRGPFVKKGNKWIVPDSDGSLFGTMGGFHWEIEKMADGNIKAIANDVWDLQPFKGDKPLVNSITGKIMHKLAKPIKNIEVGKALGIGKPLNVKVGLILDGESNKIIKTFQKGGWLNKY